MPLYIIALAKSDVLLINVIFKPHMYLYNTYNSFLKLISSQCQAARGDWQEARETLEVLPDATPLSPPPPIMGGKYCLEMKMKTSLVQVRI